MRRPCCPIGASPSSAIAARIESNEPDVTAAVAYVLQLGSHHPHTRAVDVGHTSKVDENLRLAAIDQIVDTPSKRQIAIIEQHLARQDQQRHVIDPLFLDVKFGVRHVHDYTEQRTQLQ